MSRSIPHTVTFREVTTYTTVVDAPRGEDAITKVDHMLANLSPAERARTVIALRTEREGFTAEPIRRAFTVTVEAKVIYETEVEAIDSDDACEIAEDKWNACGPDDFSFEDFMDVRVTAEAVG